jgi:hypothetical protein
MSAQPGELGLHSGKNQNRSIQVWKNIGCLDEYEVVQGSCVSYGRLHLQAELPVCLAILLNVFQHVFQCDAMALQKGIDFHPGLVTQQLAQSGSLNLALVVRC